LTRPLWKGRDQQSKGQNGRSIAGQPLTGVVPALGGEAEVAIANGDGIVAAREGIAARDGI